jgi:transcriptional regulator with XRE-family HTH domain
VIVAPANGDPASRRQAFGRRLQAARERSGVALEEIARATKVSASLLASLERGDVSRWPKGLFRRAFFRDYVIAIGLPAEPNVIEFLHLFPDGEEHPVAGAVDPDAAPALRLSLAPRAAWRVSLRDVGQEAFTAGAVLILALLVTSWVGGTLVTFLALTGLCYSSRLSLLAIRRIGSLHQRRRQSAGDSGTAAPALDAAASLAAAERRPQAPPLH